jgi:hypothetical protein
MRVSGNQITRSGGCEAHIGKMYEISQTNPINPAINVPKVPTQQVCYFGASHVRGIFDAAGEQAKLANQRKPRFIWASYPEDVAGLAANKKADGCRHAVVSVGQWDLGWPKGGITPPSEFREGVIAAIRIVLQIKDLRTAVILSTNYNPMGNRLFGCINQTRVKQPDWRAPDLVDAYNGILRHVSTELQVPFIDNTDIVGPIWDSAEDWSHPRQAFPVIAKRLNAFLADAEI